MSTGMSFKRDLIKTFSEISGYNETNAWRLRQFWWHRLAYVIWLVLIACFAIWCVTTTSTDDMFPGPQWIEVFFNLAGAVFVVAMFALALAAAYYRVIVYVICGRT